MEGESILEIIKREATELAREHQIYHGQEGLLRLISILARKCDKLQDEITELKQQLKDK